jgi:hypothetical protein
MVGGLFPNALYNVSWISLPPIKTDRHHITEKLLSMAKNDKNKQKSTLERFACSMYSRSANGDVSLGQLPSCKDAPHQNTKRANFQADIWR